jgi:hypothetical protein
MSELTFQDIDRIRRDVKGQDICFSHLADELLDHLCCDVEQEMAHGLNFSEAYRRVKGKMGHRRLKEIQEETLYAVDTKYRNMKNTMKISGIAGTAMLGIAALFKIMHWPGAGILCILGGISLAFVFMPSALTVLWKETKSREKIFLYVTAFLAAMFFIAGVVFKIQHWPFAGIILSLAAMTGVFLFIPALVVDMLRNEPDRSGKTVSVLFAVLLACYILGILFKVQHWPGSQILMITGLAGLFFVVLPWHMWLTWKDERNVSAKFIFIIVGSLAIVVPSMLLNLSMQRNFDAGFRLMLSEQQALFRYRLAENRHILDSNADTARTRLLSEINDRTMDLISTIVQLEESMISEAVGEPDTQVSRANHVIKKENGGEIQLVAMIQPFNNEPFSNHFLPGTQSRISLDRALKYYSGFISQLETGTDRSSLFLLLEPESWFPDSEEPEERTSLVSSLHLLELMKNTVLTVETRALLAVMEN